MSESERKRLDTTGRYWQVARDEEAPHDIGWRYARVLLSTHRLVLADNDGKHTIALSNVDHVERRASVETPDSAYLRILVDSDVYFVATNDLETFERELCESILDGEVLLVDHEPNGDGDSADDEGWQRARLQVEDAVATMTFEDGTFGRVDFDAVTAVERTEQTVQSEQRLVLRAEHSDGGAPVSSAFAGSERQCSALRSMFQRGAEKNFADVELDEDEREVLLALYSGVSSLDVPEFVGMDLDSVEAIYDRLVERGLVQEVRCRREVALNPSGRDVASDSMNAG